MVKMRCKPSLASVSSLFQRGVIGQPPSGHGSVIGKQWVLTAAHNFYEKEISATGRKIRKKKEKFLLEFGE